jgi:general secretion pathway protein F
VVFPLLRAEPPASITAEESAELAASLAALTQSGLPLEGGLFALSEEVSRPRLSGVLRNLAQRLQRGEKLEWSIAAEGTRLPAHLRGLIVAGVRSGRLPIVLDEFAAMARRQQDLRRRVLLSLAYPAVLLGIMAALMVFCHLLVHDAFYSIFRDFHMKLPGITDLYLRFSGVVAWTVLGLTIAAGLVPLIATILPLGAWLGRATMWVPVLGAIVYNDRHAQFASLMALLLEEEVPLPEALRLTAIAFQETMLSGQSRAAASAVEGGTALGEALARAGFADSLTAMVNWGEQKHCLAESFRAAAEAFESRTNSQSALLNMLLLPIVYVCIVTFVGVTILALMMPLLSLISALSGGYFWGATNAVRDDLWIEYVRWSSHPLFLLGIIMLMVTRLATGPSPSARDSDFAMPIRVIAWLLVAISFLAGSCLVYRDFVFFMPSMGILWLAMVAIIISLAYSMQVATQRYALLAMVGAAADRSMPLEMVFAAFGEERGGWMRRRAVEIASLLDSGVPLPEAIATVPGALPPDAVPVVCVGYENGTLGPAVRQAITARNLFEPVWQSVAPKIVYILFLPAACVGILSYIILKIMPQYEKIFRDFGTRLPEITRDLLEVCRWGFLWLPLGIFWICAVGLVIYGLLRYTDSIRWDLPGMGWLLRRRHIATVLDALALAAERERPWDEALATLAGSYPQRSVARRLWAVYDDSQTGCDALQSLHARGLLGQSDMAVLESARRNGNFAWAAREMADSNRRRFIYRTYAVVQVVFPMAIIVYGLLMAAIYGAAFLPLIQLITTLSRF